MDTRLTTTDVFAMTPGRDALPELLTDLMDEYAPSLDRHQWPIESLRWSELVFSILASLAPEPAARVATIVMDELDLIQPDALLTAIDGSDRANETTLLHGILLQAGFDAATAGRALDALGHAAAIVQSGFGGRVQQLLREESETLLNRVVARLELDTLGEETGRLAATRWLQNVLNLPIPLNTDATRAFCATQGIDEAAVVRAADALDINVAIVDDVILHWHRAWVAGNGLVPEAARAVSHEAMEAPR